MKVVNRVELKLQDFEKCHIVSDNDCPLGELYDYLCAAQSFVIAKINAARQEKESETKVEELPQE